MRKITGGRLKEKFLKLVRGGEKHMTFEMCRNHVMDIYHSQTRQKHKLLHARNKKIVIDERRQGSPGGKSGKSNEQI